MKSKTKGKLIGIGIVVVASLLFPASFYVHMVVVPILIVFFALPHVMK